MDEVVILDQEHTGDDDWDLPFSPNPRISDFEESSDDDRNQSDGGEGRF
jgi:hypothetical protein